MHSIIRLIAIATSLFILACDNTPTPRDPALDQPESRHSRSSADIEKSLRQFIDASIQRRHEDYYAMASAADHAAKSKEQYLKEQSELQPNLADAYFEKIRYEIVSIQKNDNEATADVLYHFVDVESMIKQVYNLAILNNQGLPPLDDMKQQLDTAYTDRPLPVKQVTRRFNLLNEAGTWRVYLGWDAR